MNNILEEMTINSWQPSALTSETQNQAVNALENGKIIFLPQLNFNLTEAEKKFLSPSYVDAKTKNISYDIRQQQLKGAKINEDELIPLRDMMSRFAQQARSLILALFPQYEKSLQMARTSFRPAEILGRHSSYRKDDTRLHVDAFPANPNQGKRILRVFANVNHENKPRIWRAGEPFSQVAAKFFPNLSAPSTLKANLLQLFHITHSYRTDYDHYMLNLHDTMKADLDYQKNAEQTEIHFPALSTWIVYTDCVSHAAMSGQHLLEQTFYLPVAAMTYPELSPLRILEKIANIQLVDPARWK